MGESNMSATKYWSIWAGFATSCLLTWPLHHFWLGSLELTMVLQLFLGLINIFLGIWLWNVSHRKLIVGAPIVVGILIGQWWWLSMLLILASFKFNGFAP